MSQTDMIRVATAIPKIKVADIDHNKKEILDLIHAAEEKKAGFVVFPAMTITGCTIGDLMCQKFLYDKQLEALVEIAEATQSLQIAVILGCYVKVDGEYISAAALIKDGLVQSISSKEFDPASDKQILLDDDYVPVGDFVFEDDEANMTFEIAVCDDMIDFMQKSASTYASDILFALTADTEEGGKASARRNFIKEKSRGDSSAVVLTTPGAGESSTDFSFSGHAVVTECGEIIAEGIRFATSSNLTFADIDIDRIKYTKDYTDIDEENKIFVDSLRYIEFSDTLLRHYAKNPFLPEDEKEAYEYCEDVFSIQANALAKRMEHIGLKKTILGISGGLDSTHALIVAAEAHKILGLPMSNIITVTMPGFGTTDLTYNNAVAMMKLLGTDFREVSIKDAVLKHFEDINHDENIKDLTYENAQARERTQILMDIAGKEGALLVGTGDLSEFALGWCTFNGDHMAMYGVNGSLPKTLLPHVLKYAMITRYNDVPELQATIQSVVDTPISPELLPPTTDGNIAQKTEDKVGPYLLHDFFIYHTLVSGMTPKKLLWIATQVFEGEFTEEVIRKWLKAFYGRFFSQQFKRNCSIDCPKATAVSLSPRKGFDMPSDAVSALWTNEL